MFPMPSTRSPGYGVRYEAGANGTAGYLVKTSAS
jgi:hypothetical protein